MDLDAERQRIRAWRKAISPLQHSEHSVAVSKLLQQQPIFKNAHHIGAYISSENEISPDPIIQAAWRLGKSVYLPVMNDQREYHLDFYAYNQNATLITNSYGIAEPSTKNKKVEPWKLDLVLLPLVAFDQFCNRIGRGAGFYDRCFAFANELPNSQRPQLIGLAYSDQEISSITTNPWDVAMDAIITEQTTFAKPPAN